MKLLYMYSIFKYHNIVLIRCNQIVTKDITSQIQDKQSFWKDVSDNKSWECKSQRKKDSQFEYNTRPQQHK